MVSGISFSGLASGFETDEMVQKLMHLERAPIRQLEERQNQYEEQKTTWQGIHSKLTEFNHRIDSLTAGGTFSARAATSGHEEVLTASADDRAEEGFYELNINHLATAHRLGSARFETQDASLGISGAFSLEIGDEQGSVSVAAEDSLGDIRDRINELAVPIRASMVDNRLVLSSKETGIAHRLHLVATEGTVLEDLGITSAKTATLESKTGSIGALSGSEEGTAYQVRDLDVSLSGMDFYHGLFNTEGEVVAVSADGQTYQTLTEPHTRDTLSSADRVEGDDVVFDKAVTSGDVTATFTDQTLTITGHHLAEELREPEDARFSVDGIEVNRSQNTNITDVLPHVTLNLESVGATTLEIYQDREPAMDAIEGFISDYNTLQSNFSELGQREGILQGDSTLMRLQTMIRRGVTDVVDLSEDASFKQLAQIGITVDRHGEMHLDDTKLTSALTEDAVAVGNLFSARESSDGADGVARRIDQELHTYLRYGDGILTSRERNFDQQISSIDQRIESLKRRMVRREQALWRQFTNMEQMLSDLQSQGQWLQGQIDNLNAGGRQ